MKHRILGMALVAAALFAAAGLGVRSAAASPQVTANAGGPYTAGAGQVVQLSGADSTGVNLTFSWRFSDGTIATGPIVNKVFNSFGSQTATLTVTDTMGQSATATAQVNIGGYGTSYGYPTSWATYGSYGYGSYPYSYGYYGGYYPYGYGYGYGSGYGYGNVYRLGGASYYPYGYSGSSGLGYGYGTGIGYGYGVGGFRAFGK